MGLALGIGLGTSFSGVVISGAQRLLGIETDGIAGNFLDNTLSIRDTATPANAFSGAPFSKLTFTRASSASYFNSSGLLASATTNVPRIDYSCPVAPFVGLLKEEARTNICLWNRDLTDAAWVKVTMTAAKTATGIDGVANSASTITASGALSTILQTIVSASALRVGSFYLKRRTGTGTIEITQDGAAYTTAVLTSTWQRFEIAAATIINPIIGIRITTSGDEVDVDFAQEETVAGASGGASSPIETTTASVTRAADVCSIANTLFNLSQTEGTLYAKMAMRFVYSASVAQVALSLNDGTANERAYLAGNSSAGMSQLRIMDGAVEQASITIAGVVRNTTYKIAGVYALNDFHHYRGGAAGTPDSVGTLPTTTQMNLGMAASTGQTLNGWISEFMYLPRRMTNAELQALTT